MMMGGTRCSSDPSELPGSATRVGPRAVSKWVCV